VTVLPSVTSLKQLRGLGTRASAPQPYLGFGNPIFNSGQSYTAAIIRQASTRGAKVTRSFRGTGADVSSLSKMLKPLPATADELRAVASALNAPKTDIKLGQDANERVVKSMRLSDYRILHFATHGLMADETALFNEKSEPALALTIPQKPTELDDGLLLASEVAALNLNADWVILSACNTAAGERPGEEALSGLARAFFYAGARTLMVSHWPV